MLQGAGKARRPVAVVDPSRVRPRRNAVGAGARRRPAVGTIPAMEEGMEKTSHSNKPEHTPPTSHGGDPWKGESLLSRIPAYAALRKMLRSGRRETPGAGFYTGETERDRAMAEERERREKSDARNPAGKRVS